MNAVILMNDEQLETIVGGVGWIVLIGIPKDQAFIDLLNDTVPDAAPIGFQIKQGDWS